MTIRTADEADLQALTDIYNFEVLNGVATFDLTPKTLEEQKGWLKAHNVENHPLIVAVEDGRIAGFASLSDYREKEAYAAAVELSVYVHPEFRRRGAARLLIAGLLDYARKREDIHTVISVITGGNEASIRIHEEFGFTCCGTMKEVGRKFGRYLDIVNYELLV